MIDLKRQTNLRHAIEQFYFAYRAFTDRADKVLEQKGLGRVHHRILYFVAHNPDVTVNKLLAILGVSKQALNAPLRQLIEMKLIAVKIAERDKRVKQLSLTTTGQKLENQLTSLQMQHLDTAFTVAGSKAETGWIKVMAALTENQTE
jgi:DNA-binding MarR family transcriptional regulator